MHARRPQQLGQFISFAAVLGLITNVTLVGTLTERFGEYKCLVGAAAMLSLCYLSFGMAVESLGQLGVMGVIVPLTASSTMLYTTSNAMMSKCVSADEAGTAISLSHASRSATGVPLARR